MHALVILVVALLDLWLALALVLDVGVELLGVVVEHVRVVRGVGGLGVAERGLAVADAVGAFGRIVAHAEQPTRARVWLGSGVR